MKKIIAILICLVMCGCSQGIDSAVNEAKEKDERIEVLTENINALATENEELKTELKEYEVYNKTFGVNKVDHLPGVMRTKKTAELRNYPYSDAFVLESGGGQDVIVYDQVVNEDGEDWALVKRPYFGTFAYVMVDDLLEIEYEVQLRDDTESIAGVCIGDIVEKAVAVLGDTYSSYRAPNDFFYSFGEFIYGSKSFHASIGYDPISNSIESLRVDAPGYKTRDGVQVGDQALQAISVYEEKYPRYGYIEETHESIQYEYIFRLNGDYAIDIRFDTEELNEESIITSIALYNARLYWSD